MNEFYFKKEKVNQIFNDIRKCLIEDKRTIQKAFDLDYKEWEYKVEFDKMINQIDSFKEKEYLPKFSKEKIVDGFGKIALICNQNPYLIFNFILSAIYTNNKVQVVLENKLLATNKVLIEIIKKALKTAKVDEDTITYIELTNKDNIIQKQDAYDLIYYFGNKEEYITFTKRIHIDTRFEEFGEINLFADSTEYKEHIIEIQKWAYLNEFKINLYSKEIDKAIKEINKLNNISKMTIIYSKNVETISKFIKEIKAENIFVNKNPVEEYKFGTNLNNLVYEKKIIF